MKTEEERFWRKKEIIMQWSAAEAASQGICFQ